MRRTYLKANRLVQYRRPNGRWVPATVVAVTGTPGLLACTLKLADGSTVADVQRQRLRSDTNVWNTVINASRPTLSPSSIAAFWLKASDLDALADNALVDTWTDSIGSRALTAAGGLRPTLKKNILNGQSVVRFSGAQYLRHASGTFPMGSAGAIWIVASVANLTSDYTFLCSADEASATRRVQCGFVNAGDKIYVQQANNDTADGVSGSTVLTPGQFYVFEFYSTGTNYQLRILGQLETLTVLTGADTGDWFGDTGARDSLVVGAYLANVATAHLVGDIAEVVMSTVALGNEVRGLITDYLRNKYNL